MNKIYFHNDDKERLRKHIKCNNKSNLRIKFIKYNYGYESILLQYTNISLVSIKLIVEYSHNFIKIKINPKSGFYDLCVTLKNNFRITFARCHSIYNINIHAKYTPIVTSVLTSYNRLTHKTNIECNNNIIFTQGFFNYYMKTYYSHMQYDKYNETCSYPHCGIINNSYYQPSGSDNTCDYEININMLNHKKIKQMIIISKLITKLLIHL